MPENSAHSITQWLQALSVDALSNAEAEKLLKRLYPRAYRLVHKRLLSHDDAESVSVGAVHMLVARTSAGLFEITNRAKFFALLNTIVHGAAVDRIRMRSRMRHLPNLTADGDESGIDGSFLETITSGNPEIDLIDMCNQFERRLLAILDDRQWQVFRLYYYEDRKQYEIAETLGTSKETVSRVMGQIDHVIRSLLNQHELDEIRDMAPADRTELLERMLPHLDELTLSVVQDWIAGLEPEQIEAKLEVSAHRAYSAMTFADNFIYVLRRPTPLGDLRRRVNADTSGAIRVQLFEEIKSHLHPPIERWLAADTLETLLKDNSLPPQRTVEAIRAFHESARANRDYFHA